jgi:hypothetical protein
VVLLSEYHWFRYSQRAEWELWGSKLLDAHEATASQPQEFYEEFILSNSQIFAAALAFALCVGFLLVALSAEFFARWLTFTCLGLFASVLLLLGDKERLMDDRIAWVALHWLLLTPLLFLFGSGLERFMASWRDLARAAPSFYQAAIAVAFPAAIALARFGAEEWFNEPWEYDAEIWNLWLMAYSVPLFLCAWLSEHYGTEAQRALNRLFYFLVPLFLLVPLNLLFAEQGIELFSLGHNSVRLYELCCLPAGLMILILGRLLHIESFILAALASGAVFVFRVTSRHFTDYLGWPLGIAVGGALLVALGIWRSSFTQDARAADRGRMRSKNDSVGRVFS